MSNPASLPPSLETVDEGLGPRVRVKTDFFGERYAGSVTSSKFHMHTDSSVDETVDVSLASTAVFEPGMNVDLGMNLDFGSPEEREEQKAQESPGPIPARSRSPALDIRSVSPPRPAAFAPPDSEDAVILPERDWVRAWRPGGGRRPPVLTLEQEAAGKINVVPFVLALFLFTWASLSRD
jgi:hypothetical protein